MCTLHINRGNRTNRTNRTQGHNTGESNTMHEGILEIKDTNLNENENVLVVVIYVVFKILT